MLISDKKFLVGAGECVEFGDACKHLQSLKFGTVLFPKAELLAKMRKHRDQG